MAALQGCYNVRMLKYHLSVSLSFLPLHFSAKTGYRLTERSFCHNVTCPRLQSANRESWIVNRESRFAIQCVPFSIEFVNTQVEHFFSLKSLKSFCCRKNVHLLAVCRDCDWGTLTIWRYSASVSFSLVHHFFSVSQQSDALLWRHRVNFLS